MSQRHLTVLLLAIASLAIATSPASATRINKARTARYLGSHLPLRLNNCQLCHTSANAHGAQSLDEFPHNPFGDRLRQLTNDKQSTIEDRLAQIIDEDADGDGVSNLDEILAGTFPGNPKDTPKSLDTEQQSQRRQAYMEHTGRYRWRPFQPVTKPDVPTDDVGGWTHNAIDRFIAEQHVDKGLTPSPEALPHQLLRRVYLDLIGLNPSAETLDRFVRDYAKDPAAYDRIVDELLDSTAYGERWGRHWMDIWRYSDWAGYRQELRESQRHIWHWRDWIVESLNADKGYDRMIQEMIAADELTPDDYQAIRATGYLARNYFRNRDQWMDNVVKYTAQAFLGVTLGCSKCHDHMYDQFPQEDYYAMRAIFESYNVRTDHVPGQMDVKVNGLPRAFDNSVNASTFLFQRGDERFPQKDQPIKPNVPARLGGKFEVRPIDLPVAASHPHQRSFVREGLLKQASDTIAKAKHDLQRTAAESKLASLEALFNIERLEEADNKNTPEWKQAATMLVKLQRRAKLDDATWKLEQADQAINKAEADLSKAKASKNSASISKANRAISTAKKNRDTAVKSLKTARTAVKAPVNTTYEARSKAYPRTSSGRRTAFARWLTDRKNPLTARVAMNHIWLRHFGKPIVPTVAEFGANGREPTHPALLDFLAAEMMDNNWSMKHMHRLIVTSATYRQSSLNNTTNTQRDPDNNHLWRYPSRRVEGEVVRDNLLSIAGALDTTMGGPDIDHNAAETSRRRSIYLRHAHEKLVEFVQIFDGPSVTECFMRDESVQPHQALALANSSLSFKAASAIARRLMDTDDPDVDRIITDAFKIVLTREPTEEELNLCFEFIATKPEVNQRTVRNLLLVLINHNDFVTVR